MTMKANLTMWDLIHNTHFLHSSGTVLFLFLSFWTLQVDRSVLCTRCKFSQISITCVVSRGCGRCRLSHGFHHHHWEGPRHGNFYTNMLKAHVLWRNLHARLVYWAFPILDPNLVKRAHTVSHSFFMLFNQMLLCPNSNMSITVED